MLASRKGFYGYIAVFAGFLVYLLVVGSYFGLVVVAGSMARDLGWSTTQLSAAFSLYMLTGLGAPLYGMLIQRWGPRISMIAGTALSAAGWLAVATTNSLPQYYFGVMLMGLGAWPTTMIPLAQLVGNWFSVRRTPMMGLAMTAGGFGGLIFSNLAQAIESAFGSWRGTWFTLMGLMILACAIAVLLIRDRPEELGQQADGAPSSPNEGQTTEDGIRSSHVYRTETQWEVGAALRTPALRLILVAMGAMGFAVQGMVTHQVIYFRDELLLSPSLAAAAAGMVPLASIAGRILSGWLGARIQIRIVMSAFVGLLAVSLATLVVWQSAPAVVVYALLFGPGWGGMVILPNASLMDYFGTRNFARLSGIAMGLVCVMQAAAPVIIGALRDSAGSYVPGFTLMAALTLAGSLAVLFALPPRTPRPAAQGARQEGDFRESA